MNLKMGLGRKMGIEVFMRVVFYSFLPASFLAFGQLNRKRLKWAPLGLRVDFAPACRASRLSAKGL
jgi:hypothetical protein